MKEALAARVERWHEDVARAIEFFDFYCWYAPKDDEFFRTVVSDFEDLAPQMETDAGRALLKECLRELNELAALERRETVDA